MKRFVKNLVLLVLGLTLIFSPWSLAQQKNDEEYSKKIIEYTSEKFFLTELVDHLPASDSVPTPAEILGDVIGAPNILHDTSQIETYIKALAEATPRATAFSIGGTDAPLPSKKPRPTWPRRKVLSEATIIGFSMSSK